LIFIDEIDAVGRQRGAGIGGGNDEQPTAYGNGRFEGNTGIIIIAATAPTSSLYCDRDALTGK